MTKSYGRVIRATTCVLALLGSTSLFALKNELPTEKNSEEKGSTHVDKLDTSTSGRGAASESSSTGVSHSDSLDSSASESTGWVRIGSSQYSVQGAPQDISDTHPEVSKLVNKHMTEKVGGFLRAAYKGAHDQEGYKNAILSIKSNFPEDLVAQRLALKQLKEHYAASKDAINDRGQSNRFATKASFHHDEINKHLKDFDADIQKIELKKKKNLLQNLKLESEVVHLKKEAVIQVEEKQQKEGFQARLDKKRAEVAAKKKEAEATQPSKEHVSEQHVQLEKQEIPAHDAKIASASEVLKPASGLSKPTTSAKPVSSKIADNSRLTRPTAASALKTTSAATPASLGVSKAPSAAKPPVVSAPKSITPATPGVLKAPSAAKPTTASTAQSIISTVKSTVAAKTGATPRVSTAPAGSRGPVTHGEKKVATPSVHTPSVHHVEQ